MPSRPSAVPSKYSAISAVTLIASPSPIIDCSRFDGNNVTFRWRDYAQGNVKRTMTVSAEEFIRRFLLHVLPKGFVRIRHFGFMANYRRSESFDLCRQLLGMAPVVRSTEVASTNRSWLCPTLSGTLDRHPEADCDQTLLEILYRNVSQIPRSGDSNSNPIDVPRHACADVCLLAAVTPLSSSLSIFQQHSQT